MAHTYARQSHMLKQTRHASVPTCGHCQISGFSNYSCKKDVNPQEKPLIPPQTAHWWLAALFHLWLHHLSFLLLRIMKTAVTSSFWKLCANAVCYQVVIVKYLEQEAFFVFLFRILIPRFLHPWCQVTAGNYRAVAACSLSHFTHFQQLSVAVNYFQKIPTGGM